jgi:hypothetical protein
VSGCVTCCHLCFFLSSSVYVCVCPGLCAIVCCVCFPGLFVQYWYFGPPLRIVNCEGLLFIATCVLLASSVYVCVCAQVGCSVVYNWSLCDLSVDVCVLIC